MIKGQQSNFELIIAKKKNSQLAQRLLGYENEKKKLNGSWPKLLSFV
jgi:hypothetical protein